MCVVCSCVCLLVGVFVWCSAPAPAVALFVAAALLRSHMRWRVPWGSVCWEVWCHIRPRCRPQFEPAGCFKFLIAATICGHKSKYIEQTQKTCTSMGQCQSSKTKYKPCLAASVRPWAPPNGTNAAHANHKQMSRVKKAARSQRPASAVPTGPNPALPAQYPAGPGSSMLGT